jgi:quercetin dioxygenase-like cupin family protein
MSEYPRTIDNGGGERITLLGVAHDERGEYLEITNTVSPGKGPPMHVHHLQEEALTIERGTMAYQEPGGEERRAGPGETASFAPGVPHRFWNAGDDELASTGFARPPQNIEYFLTQLYASMRRNGGERPGLFDTAYLLGRYRDEFGMLEIPAPVQRFVFPVILAVGRLLGKHSRFADAPEPVRRGA